MLGNLHWDLADLAAHLRRERLFVNSEQQNLQQLNEKVVQVSNSLAQLAWITSHQRLNLNRLVLARVDCFPALICQRIYTIDNVMFIDAKKVLGYQDTQLYGEFFTCLRNSPELIANCLSVGDRLCSESMPSILNTLSSGLFGSCLLPEDKRLVLKLLRNLAELQLVQSDDPRRLLRHGSCAFARLYSVFHESLFSSKVFLTGALHGPIMKLLMDDEMFLDIDPDKCIIRCLPEDRIKKFGVKGTPEYYVKLQRYREWIISRLVNLAEIFISSIRDNMCYFPSSVLWLVRQLAGLFCKAGYLGEKEIFEISTDLVFTCFICPAIVNPEPFGITDAPIGHVARFNLMQVAQILQMLAMRKYEVIDSKVADLYNHFHQDCVSSLLENILVNCTDILDEPPPAEENIQLQKISRSATLITHNQLNGLVQFLQDIVQCEDELFDKKELESLLSRLPPATTNGHRTDVKPDIKTTIAEKKSGLANNSKPRTYSSSNTSEGIFVSDEQIPEDVLVIPFSFNNGEVLGLLSEQKVLEESRQNVEISVVTGGQDLTDSTGGVVHSTESQEKRTRFSLSHDEGSIGNTSDNLEVVSEAASNHSVASSIESENEDQNDNLSDMVSANVSGRGTPNISGRDTPSSQITEGEEVRGVGPEPVAAVSKPSRSDIDDKFCKFEIKKQEMMVDETVSMVSDTWSTDVLASDNETVEQLPRPTDYIPTHNFIQHSLDISETASEAWSTDVLPSDSERMIEVDTDDTASVATTRSEVGSRGEVETPPPQPPSVGPAVFRPIREDPINRLSSLVVPPSPTRSEHTPWNVTGRGGGKAEYRRRTVEFVDAGIAAQRGYPKPGTSNGMIHVIDKMDQQHAKSGNLKSSSASGRNGVVVPVTRTRPILQPNLNSSLPNGIVNPILPDHNEIIVPVPNQAYEPVTPAFIIPSVPPSRDSVQDGVSVRHDLFDNSGLSALSTPSTPVYVDKQAEGKVKQEEEETERVFHSSTSLASTSSSSCSAGPTAATAPQSATPSSSNTCDLPTGSKTMSSSTGAIPKSISFDKSAERGDKELLDEDQKQKKGFFRNFKMTFKGRRSKHVKCEDVSRYDQLTSPHLPPSTVNNNNNNDSYSCSKYRECRTSQTGDVIEDILAKYRRKPSTGGDSLSSDVHDTGRKTNDNCDNEDDEPMSDETIFEDAKRKLRLVFSMADLQNLPWNGVVNQRENELVAFLKLQLYEAINLQSRSLVSQLHETMRCVRLFDDNGCRRLSQSLKEDYQNRTPYISYLISCRQALLSTLGHFERITERIECDNKLCGSFLVALCVRIFLERNEDVCLEFTHEFQQLTLSDEKTDLLETFLLKLDRQMKSDAMWQGGSEEQFEQAQAVIETAIISRVYPYALFPNGDGDISRDQVLHEHIKKLSNVITLNHKDLRIPKRYHSECPWPSAQAEISTLGAYKTPRDKVACVYRCATTIMNLLSMSSEGRVPAADDFVPVLVFVLIEANPPALLSTIQYVECFYSSRLGGEQQYWWTQFCSAIEFIKTMDYNV